MQKICYIINVNYKLFNKPNKCFVNSQREQSISVIFYQTATASYGHIKLDRRVGVDRIAAVSYDSG